MLKLKKFWPLPIGVAAGLAIWAGCQTGQMAATPPVPIVTLPVNSLQPGPDDPKIAFITARLLEEYDYLQQPLDDKISTNFFDGYINALDGRHEYFLQSDIDEFARFRTNLDVLTINTNMMADLSPAFLIYQRFQQRFEQRSAFVAELLQQDKFKLNTDDKIEIDRRHAPFPKDLDEAKELWEKWVRYDYLRDKLGREISETNGVFTVKLPAEANTNIIAELQKGNRWNLHQLTNQDSDWVLQSYLNALAHAYDPHSDYFSAPHAQDFSIQMNLSLFGIGAQLTEDFGYCTIHSLVPGGPASKSKLINEKDRIIAVAQGSKPPVNVVDMDLEKVVQQIRGPKGTEVRLTISQAPDFDTNALKVVALTRDEIKLEDSEAKAKLLEIPDGRGGTNRIGILDLPSFYAPVGDDNGRSTPKYTTEDVAKLIKKLKDEHVSGILVDLRYNPGGSLEEAIKFTGLFIKEGPVVQARNLGGPTVVESDTDPDQLYAGPLVVMVNRFSASAAEIAAAALQDYGRAVVVGDVSTHGKGTVQSLNKLQPFMMNSTNDPGELKITIRKFYRITGASTQLKGVMPDIVLPDIFNYSTQIGESNLDNPLPWDVIDAASYKKMDLVQPYLAELSQRSTARVLTNQDYDYVRQDIEQYKKSQAEGTATLNEHEAIKERERDTLNAEARQKEQENRPDPGVKVYELTVRNSADPGLPAPRPYLTTNYDNSPVANTLANELRAEVKAPNQFVYLYTNFFNDGYVMGFTNFFQTNCTSIAGVKYVYTNSISTNIIARYDNWLNATNEASQVFKPVVTRTYGPDAMLDESVRILEDYVLLLQKSGSLTSVP